MGEIKEVNEVKEVQEIKPEDEIDRFIRQQKACLTEIKGKVPKEIYDALESVTYDIIDHIQRERENWLSTNYMGEELLEDTRQLLSCFAEQLGIDKVHEIKGLEKDLKKINCSQLIALNLVMLKQQSRLVERNGDMRRRENYCAKKEDRDETIKCMNHILEEVCEVGKDTPRFGEDTKSNKKDKNKKVNNYIDDSAIILNAKLASIVNKALREMGIEHKSAKFSKEQLDLVTSIKIDPVSKILDLQGIEQLKNLQTLVISNGEQRTEGLLKKNIKSIDEKNMEAICNCTSLKNLTIKNQAFIEKIDLSKLQNLEQLDISYNQYLKEVEGLDKLKKLQSLTVFGNNRLYTVKDLDNIILSNNLRKLNLDVLMFPDAIGYDKDSGRFNVNALKKIVEIDTKWCEQINGLTNPRGGAISTVKFSNYEMIKLHNKACEILEKNVPRGASKWDTISGVENYLAQNVKYDYEGLKDKKSKTVFGEDLGQKYGINSAYNALMYNKAVCEGYTHAMQYLLKLRGIRSHNACCFIKRSEKFDDSFIDKLTKMSDANYSIDNDGEFPLNHSIICIDGAIPLYDDPTWNAGHYQQGDREFKWVLRQKSEILKDHYLSPGEREQKDMRSPTNSIIKKSIEKNEAFKKTKKTDISKVFGKIRMHTEIGSKIVIEEGDEIGK